jgi:hypothetical protein
MMRSRTTKGGIDLRLLQQRSDAHQHPHVVRLGPATMGEERVATVLHMREAECGRSTVESTTLLDEAALRMKRIRMRMRVLLKIANSSDYNNCRVHVYGLASKFFNGSTAKHVSLAARHWLMHVDEQRLQMM